MANLPSDGISSKIHKAPEDNSVYSFKTRKLVVECAESDVKARTGRVVTRTFRLRLN